MSYSSGSISGAGGSGSCFKLWRVTVRARLSPWLGVQYENFWVRAHVVQSFELEVLRHGLYFNHIRIVLGFGRLSKTVVQVYLKTSMHPLESRKKCIPQQSLHQFWDIQLQISQTNYNPGRGIEMENESKSKLTIWPIKNSLFGQLQNSHQQRNPPTKIYHLID
jgi:hypothetical protein